MSLAIIRAEYKTILETVADVGVVHRYARLATDWAKFLALFKTTIGGQTVIRGWEITRESAGPSRHMLNGTADRDHNILIRGYAGLQDASGSSETFDDLCEAILDKFEPLLTLNGKVKIATPMALSLLAEREFGGALCHYAELRQRVTDRIFY